jgi:hypothetical protein
MTASVVDPNPHIPDLKYSETLIYRISSWRVSVAKVVPSSPIISP